jgi:hypothetical protein
MIYIRSITDGMGSSRQGSRWPTKKSPQRRGIVKFLSTTRSALVLAVDRIYLPAASIEICASLSLGATCPR